MSELVDGHFLQYSGLIDLTVEINKVLRGMQKQNVLKRIIVAEDIRRTLEQYTGRLMRSVNGFRSVWSLGWRLCNPAFLSSAQRYHLKISLRRSISCILATSSDEEDFHSDHMLLKLGDNTLGLETGYPDVEESEADAKKRVVGRIDEYSGRLTTTGGMPVFVRCYEGQNLR
ncbi:hypothetical protein C8J56DRAFT_881818 [Mycena floridula]|nr:hypothetical protein C8J56DRAFT_881818 [Mycena floridula]